MPSSEFRDEHNSGYSFGAGNICAMKRPTELYFQTSMDSPAHAFDATASTGCSQTSKGRGRNKCIQYSSVRILETTSALHISVSLHILTTLTRFKWPTVLYSTIRVQHFLIHVH